MALGNAIRKYMESLGIGNKELAELSGVPLRTINNIVGGLTENPTLETVKLIAKALGCSIDDIADTMNNESTYYLDPAAAEIAQQVYERPELKMLFDASRKVSSEDLEAVIALVNRMKKDQDGEK